MYERSIHVRSILRSLLPRLVHAEGSLSGSEMLSILRGLRAMRKSYDHLRILSHTNQKAKVFENQKTPDYSCILILILIVILIVILILTGI